MGIVDSTRATRRWLAAARSLARPRSRREPSPAAAPPDREAAAQTAPRRPPDAALLARLGRWRGRPAAPDKGQALTMTARERAAAMRDLEAMRSRLGREQAELIDAALAAGAVTVRRLGPGDGHLWEMPGMRVFAIVGVQAFTVEEQAGPPEL